MIQFMNFTLWWHRRETSHVPQSTDTEKELYTKCGNLEQSLKISQSRFLCLMSVIAGHKTPVLYEFHTTAKGIPILLCIVNEGCELELYNLNNNGQAHCMLRLSAVYFGKEACITNIVGGVRLGHGRLAVARFLQLCKSKGVEKASAEFIAIEKDTAVALVSFFAKCGFELYKQMGNRREMRVLL